MKPTHESENLAERLRELYQEHGCESELPEHEDLVKKLDTLSRADRGYFQETIDAGVGRQISYEEALQAAQQRPRFNYGEILGEVVYGTVRTVASGNLRKTLEMFFFEIPDRLERETVESLRPYSEQAEEYLKYINESAKKDFDVYIRDEIGRAFTKASKQSRKKGEVGFGRDNNGTN